MKPLFIDTNLVNTNSSLRGLLGNRGELQKLEKTCRILLPSVVRDELIEHARVQFSKDKDRFLNNCFARKYPEQVADVSAACFEDMLDEIIKLEDVEYEVVEFEDERSFFKKFYPLAIGHKPPFEEKSDKGFKDACIAHTIECFADQCGETFLLTDDRRLAQYFESNPNVQVFQSFKKLQAYLADVCETQEQDVDGHTCSDDEPAINDRRIDGELVERLCESSSFKNTHNAIAAIVDCGLNLAAEQEIRLLRAAATNDQILWLLRDRDVEQFFLPIFNKYEERLADSQYNAFVDAAGLPNDRLTEYGAFQMSRSEKEAYNSFVEGLTEHLISRDVFSSVIFDSEIIISRLKELLCSSAIDEKLLTWQQAIGTFIDGDFCASEGVASRELLEDFYKMLQNCSAGKREEILKRVVQRIEESECELVA